MTPNAIPYILFFIGGFLIAMSLTVYMVKVPLCNLAVEADNLEAMTSYCPRDRLARELKGENK